MSRAGRRAFVEKPQEPPPGVGSMGIYVFNYADLDRVLLEDAQMEGSEPRLRQGHPARG